MIIIKAKPMDLWKNGDITSYLEGLRSYLTIAEFM